MLIDNLHPYVKDFLEMHLRERLTALLGVSFSHSWTHFFQLYWHTRLAVSSSAANVWDEVKQMIPSFSVKAQFMAVECCVLN